MESSQEFQGLRHLYATGPSIQIVSPAAVAILETFHVIRKTPIAMPKIIK
jgi:hypothetical protein